LFWYREGQCRSTKAKARTGTRDGEEQEPDLKLIPTEIELHGSGDLSCEKGFVDRVTVTAEYCRAFKKLREVL
jgi:hypothetical protein